jgi:hypothetical protein
MISTYTALEEGKAHNFRENILHLTRKGAQVLGTSGLDTADFVDKLAISPIFRKLGKEPPTSEVLKSLKDQLQEVGNSSNFRELESAQSLASQLEAQYLDLHDGLIQECQKQRSTLQEYSLEELLALGLRSEALPVVLRLEQLIEETSHKLPPPEKMPYRKN